jgi:hypothetical protein
MMNYLAVAFAWGGGILIGMSVGFFFGCLYMKSKPKPKSRKFRHGWGLHSHVYFEVLDGVSDCAIIHFKDKRPSFETYAYDISDFVVGLCTGEWEEIDDGTG